MKRQIIYQLGCFALCLFFWAPLHGQILDDSTKNVYSAKTTFWFTEADVRSLRDSLNVLDTLLYGFEDFEAVDRSQHRLADLGNIGTATRSIYFEFPVTIGARTGIDAYQPFFIYSRNIRYYDTKSPFIRLHSSFGMMGRNSVDVGYTRNVNPRWNVGADFRRISADKQIGASSNRGDRNIESTGLDLYTSYRTENERYHALFNISWLNHGIFETGGINVPEGASTAEIFQYRDSDIRLRGPRAGDRRFNVRLFQKYELNEQLQAYYSLDLYRQQNTYVDVSLTENSDFYPAILVSQDSTSELLQFRGLTHEAGILGKAGDISYNVYLKRRNVNYNDRYLAPFGTEVENYGGVRASAVLFDVWDTESRIEFMQGGLFDAYGRTSLPFLELWLRSMRYKPGYQQQYFYGNHHSWQNDFVPQRADQIGGEIDLNVGPLSLKPALSLSRVANMVYFDADSRPQQSNSGQLITSPSVSFDLALFEDFHINPQLIYTVVTGNESEIWRIPDWFSNVRLYYAGYWFDTYLQIQIGTDLHWKSTYFGHDWNPAIQQFHLQNHFPVESYLVADLFINFKVNNARFFAKATHLNQAGASGYFVTPWYPGQQRVFDMGVTWYFFD